MTVLTVTGATGHVGRRVAERLGPLVSRLVVRDPSLAPRLAGAAPEVRQADYRDAAAARAALAGSYVLFMVSAAGAPDRRSGRGDEGAVLPAPRQPTTTASSPPRTPRTADAPLFEALVMSVVR